MVKRFKYNLPHSNMPQMLKKNKKDKKKERKRINIFPVPDLDFPLLDSDIWGPRQEMRQC